MGSTPLCAPTLMTAHQAALLQKTPGRESLRVRCARRKDISKAPPSSSPSFQRWRIGPAMVWQMPPQATQAACLQAPARPQEMRQTSLQTERVLWPQPQLPWRARTSLLTKPAAKEAAGPPARAQDKPGTGKPPASPRSSVDGTSMSRADGAVNSRSALSPGPLGATAAIALGIARGPGPRDEPAPFARQSCARVRASLELRRRSGDGGAPAREPPPISFPQLPSVPVPAQLPMSFIKSPSQSQRNSIEERPSPNGKDTGSVLAAVAAQLGQSAASPRASFELAAAGRAASARRSSQLQRQLPTVDEGVATGVACNARELSLKLGVPDLRAQPSSDTSPADASHEPPDLEPATPAASAPAAGNEAAGRLAAAHQLFFQGAQPARKRMSTSAGMLAAENAASPLQLPGPSPRLRPLLLSPSTSASDRNTLLQR